MKSRPESSFQALVGQAAGSGLTKCRIALGTGIILASLAFRSPLDAGGLSFGPIQTLSGTAGSTKCRLKAGMNGDFHLSYISGGLVNYARYRKGSWSEILTCGSAGQVNIYADVAGDRKGNAYLAWCDVKGSVLHLATITNAKDAKHEEVPVGKGWHAGICVDTLDYVRAFCDEHEPDRTRMWSKRIGTDAWTVSEIGISECERTVAGGQRQPSIVAKRDAKLFYGYQWYCEKGNRRIAFREFNCRTERWSEPIFTLGGLKPFGPQMFVDSKNKVHMAWCAGQDPEGSAERAWVAKMYSHEDRKEIIQLQRSLGGGEYQWPTLVAVSDKGLVLVVGTTGVEAKHGKAAGQAYYVIGDGRSFTEPKLIEEGKPVTSWAALAAHGNTFLLAWVSDELIRYRTAVDDSQP